MPRTLADARVHAREKLGRGRGERAFNLLKRRPADYGLVIKPSGHYNEKVIGVENEAGKYISTLVGKRIQNSGV